MGFLIIFIIMMFIFHKEMRFTDIEDWALGSIMSILGSALITLAVSIPLLIFFDKETGYKEEYRLPIASVMNKDGFNGRFALGSGSIQSYQYYYAMQDLGNSSYKPINIKQDEVDYIKESNETPSLVVYKNIRYNKPAQYLTGIPFNIEEYRYAFIVPNNTVIVQYKVN